MSINENTIPEGGEAIPKKNMKIVKGGYQATQYYPISNPGDLIIRDDNCTSTKLMLESLDQFCGVR